VLEELFERYLAGLTGSKLLASQQHLPKLSLFCQRLGLRLDQVAPEQLDEFRQSLLWVPAPHGRLYSANTVSQVLIRTRQFLRWAFHEGFLETDPSSNLRVGAVVKVQGRLLNSGELRRILDGPNRNTPTGLRDSLFLALVTVTSLKIKECLGLRLSDLERLPFESSVSELVERYLRESRPLLGQAGQETALLLSRSGRPLSVSSSTQIAKLWGQRVGLGAGIHARLLRRSWLAEAESFARRRAPFPLTDETP
jgi:integrase/recombinase XerD